MDPIASRDTNLISAAVLLPLPKAKGKKSKILTYAFPVLVELKRL